jgi:hypothetical protein
VESTAGPAAPIIHNDVVSSPSRESNHETEIGPVTSNDLVAIRTSATEQRTGHIGSTADQRDAVERAQSHRCGIDCNDDEIAVAIVRQRNRRSNGNVIDRHTNDTPSTGVGVHGLTGASNSSMDDEEDSNDIDPTDNISNDVRSRAKRA